MREPPKVTRAVPLRTSTHQAADAESGKTLCDRCGQEMYRMHAVWRCLGCGYKTDCFGW